MNLREALQFAALQQKSSKAREVQDRCSAKRMVRRIFQLAAQAGNPFRYVSQKAWQRRWMASREFVKVDIDINRVAVPGMAHDTNKVLGEMRASAGALEPIVVDLNKNEIGRSPNGYCPRVIALDGKHRHQARILQGHGVITAWVGVKALPYVQAAVMANVTPQKANGGGTRIDVAMMAVAVPRQDRAQNGSAPHQRIPSAFPTKGNGNLDVKPQPYAEGWPTPRIKANSGMVQLPDGSGAFTGTVKGHGGMGGPGASLGTGGSSNPSRIGVYSDADPSDVSQGHAPDLEDPSDIDQDSPARQSPGGGVGPRTKPSTGGSKSELTQKRVRAGQGEHVREVFTGPKVVKKIVTKNKKKLAAVAPPGREKQVLKLKEKFGEDSATPFKIAWHSYNQGK